MFEKLKAEFIFNFIEGDRWKYIVNGLGVTLQVTFFALLLGTVIGVIVASLIVCLFLATAVNAFLQANGIIG